MFWVGGAGQGGVGWGVGGWGFPPKDRLIKGVQPQFEDLSHLLYLTQLPTAISLNFLKLLNNKYPLFR